MALEFAQNLKARARGIPLEKNEVSTSVTELDDDLLDTKTSRKSSASNLVSNPGSEKGSVGPRTFRSMLDVKEPPSIEPLNPMSYEELYAGRGDSSALVGCEANSIAT